MTADNAVELLTVWLGAAAIAAAGWGLAVGAGAIGRWRRERRREAGDE